MSEVDTEKSKTSPRTSKIITFGITLILTTLLLTGITYAECDICNETCSPCGGGCTATDLSWMFVDITDWSSIGEIIDWNTSCITNMAHMFSGSDFNQDIGMWDTSQVTNMQGMFSNNPSFDQDISGWNTSSVIDMKSMFNSATAFNQAIGSWDTHNVQNMVQLFYDATAFNQDLSLWNISSVTQIDAMFSNVNLSIENYNAILTGWSNTTPQPNLIFDAGLSQYSAEGAIGRQVLIETYGWTINDGGEYDVIFPIVSFCEEYTDQELLESPMDGQIYDENSLVNQVSCAYDARLNNITWTVYEAGYVASYDTDMMQSFLNPVPSEPDIYFINESIPASNIFNSDGKYYLITQASDIKGNIAEINKTVYYDNTPPDIYFCEDFGGITPETGTVLTADSDLWIDICANDYLLSEVNLRITDIMDNAIIEDSTWIEESEDCVTSVCGFSQGFSPLGDYLSENKAYYIQAKATDRAEHESYAELRLIYYDTEPPVFASINIADNSTLNNFNENITVQFYDHTIGYMLFNIYDENYSIINQYEAHNCIYNDDGYGFMDDTGIICTITPNEVNISSNGNYIINATYTDGANLTGYSDIITFEIGCSENWIQIPLNCTSESVFVSYIDTNSCGTTENLPEDNGTIIDNGKCYYSNNNILSDCGTIVESGNYSMNTSITELPTCIKIQSDNVTLDCVGYIITANIELYSSTNLMLKNCRVNGSIIAIGQSYEYYYNNYTNSSGYIEGIINITNSTVDTIIKDTNISSSNSSNYTSNASSTIVMYDSVIFNISTTSQQGPSQIILSNSRIDFDSSIDLNGGMITLDNAYFENEFGVIQFSYVRTNATNFRSIVFITNNSAYVDYINYPEYNVPSIVTLDLTEWNITNPGVRKNGENCIDCSILEYSDNILFFTVESWGNYTIINITEAEETVSLLPSRNGHGTNPNLNTSEKCREDWICGSWSDCSRFGASTRTCYDRNSCGTEDTMPKILQSCTSNTQNNDFKNNSAESSNKPKKALFDIIGEIVTEPKKVGEDLIVKISLINFGSSDSVDANLEYTISDGNGMIVRRYNKTVLVTTQTEFLDYVSTTGLLKGKYSLNIKLTYEGQTDPASTEKIFYIGKSIVSKILRNNMLAILSTSIITIVFIIYLYLKIRRDKDTRYKSISTGGISGGRVFDKITLNQIDNKKNITHTSHIENNTKENKKSCKRNNNSKKTYVKKIK